MKAPVDVLKGRAVKSSNESIPGLDFRTGRTVKRRGERRSGGKG